MSFVKPVLNSVFFKVKDIFVMIVFLTIFYFKRLQCASFLFVSLVCQDLRTCL